jgi:hypothetical protein
MWTAVPAAVFVTALILTFVTLTVSVLLTRRQKGKTLIEVRLFGLGFTINRETESSPENKEIIESVDPARPNSNNQTRDNHRGRSQ